MQSGSPQTTMDISSGQQRYDKLVSDMGCSGADDTLDCLRGVPYEKLKQGVDDLSPGMFTYEVCDCCGWPVMILAADRRIVGRVADMADHCRSRFLIRHPNPTGTGRERGPNTGPHR